VRMRHRATMSESLLGGEFFNIPILLVKGTAQDRGFRRHWLGYEVQ
jgi:hypothetical protein